MNRHPYMPMEEFSDQDISVLEEDVCAKMERIVEYISQVLGRKINPHYSRYYTREKTGQTCTCRCSAIACTERWPGANICASRTSED